MVLCCIFFIQAEDGIRDLVRSRGLGDVYKRQWEESGREEGADWNAMVQRRPEDKRQPRIDGRQVTVSYTHLTLPTSDLV